MEHNYQNLHLEGTIKEQREMAHNQRPIKHSSFSLGNLVGAFLVLAIGAQVLGAVTSNLRKQGIM